MPKSANKRSARKGGSSGSKPSKPSSGKRGANVQSIAYASSAMRKSYFDVSAHKLGGRRVLRVNLCDSMGLLFGPARENGIKSDSVKFSLASNSLALSSLGQVFPKLQGLARVASRYQVRKARLHWQSLCSADLKGSVALAIVPGIVDPVISIAEMASFEHGVVGPLRMNFSTTEYKNLEQRWFMCDAAENQTGTDPDYNTPFSILRLIKEETNAETGLVWLELEIDFVDLRPASQSSVNLQTGVPAAGAQTFTGTGTGSSNFMAWGLNQGMEGLFEWGQDWAQSYFLSAAPSTPIVTPPGAAIGVDGDSQIDAWLDLFVNAVTAPERKQHPLSEWPVQVWDDVKTSEDQVFPRPWTQPKRHRVICAFKSVKEARAARLAGFNPELLVKDSPNAAGDFNVGLFFQPAEPYAVLELIALETVSGGTGAFEHIIQHSTTLDAGPGHLYWTLVPTGTESRTISANSNTSVDVINRVPF